MSCPRNKDSINLFWQHRVASFSTIIEREWDWKMKELSETFVNVAMHKIPSFVADEDQQILALNGSIKWGGIFSSLCVWRKNILVP